MGLVMLENSSDLSAVKPQADWSLTLHAQHRPPGAFCPCAQGPIICNAHPVPQASQQGHRGPGHGLGLAFTSSLLLPPGEPGLATWPQ